MAYYMGDYYRGDYYQGDLKGLFRRVASGVKGFISGGPVGAIGGFIGPKAPTMYIAPPTLPAPRPGTSVAPPPAGYGQAVPKPGVRGALERVLPGGSSGFIFRKRRTMNPANVRALRRAIRRAEGFERLAKRVGRFTQPGKGFSLSVRKRAKRCR